MNDGTNPKQQKASAVQSDHRAGWTVSERFGLLCSRRAWVNESMFSFYPVVPLPKRPAKQAKQLFVELLSANGDTQHIAQVSDCALSSADPSGVWDFGEAGC
jgi:hypothetical protein